MKTLIEHLDFIFTVDKDDTILYDAAIVLEDDTITDLGTTCPVTA